MNTTDCLNIYIRYKQKNKKIFNDKYKLSQYIKKNKANYELIVNTIFEFAYFLNLKEKIATNLGYNYDNYTDLHNWDIPEYMSGYQYYQYSYDLGKYYQYSYDLFEKDPEFWKYVIGSYRKPHSSKVSFTEDIAPPELNITDSIPSGGIKLSDHYKLHNSIKLYVKRDIQNINIRDIYHDSSRKILINDIVLINDKVLIDDIVINCLFSYTFLTKFKHILPWKQIAMFNKTDFNILKQFVDSRYHCYNYCSKSSMESDEQILNKNRDINYISVKLFLLNKNIKLDLEKVVTIEFIKKYQYTIILNNISTDDYSKYEYQVNLVEKYGEQIINLTLNLNWNLEYLTEEKLIDKSKINGSNYFWNFRPNRRPYDAKIDEGEPWTYTVCLDTNKKYLVLYHGWIYTDSLIIVPEDEKYIYLLGEQIENPYTSLVDRIKWYDENSNRSFTPMILYVEFDKGENEWVFNESI